MAAARTGRRVVAGAVVVAAPVVGVVVGAVVVARVCVETVRRPCFAGLRFGFGFVAVVADCGGGTVAAVLVMSVVVSSVVVVPVVVACVVVVALAVVVPAAWAYVPAAKPAIAIAAPRQP